MNIRDDFFRTFDRLFELMKADPVPLSQNDFIKISQMVYSCIRRGLLRVPRPSASYTRSWRKESARGGSGGKGCAQGVDLHGSP
jgi:hypothetical protein